MSHSRGVAVRRLAEGGGITGQRPASRTTIAQHRGPRPRSRVRAGSQSFMNYIFSIVAGNTHLAIYIYLLCRLSYRGDDPRRRPHVAVTFAVQCTVRGRRARGGSRAARGERRRAPGTAYPRFCALRLRASRPLVGVTIFATFPGGTGSVCRQRQARARRTGRRQQSCGTVGALPLGNLHVGQHVPPRSTWGQLGLGLGLG